MHKIILVFLFVTVCFISEARSQVRTTSEWISLEEAKKIAADNNPEIAAAKAIKAEKLAKYGVSKSAFYPKIGAAGGTNGEFYASEKKTEPILYLYASMNLFNGLQDHKNASVAKMEIEASDLNLLRTLQSIQGQVEQHFYAYLFTKEILNLKSKSLATNKQLAEVAMKRRQAGAASEADVLEFALRENILGSEMAALEQEKHDALLALYKVMGLGPLSAQPSGTMEHWHIKGNIEHYVEKLKKESPQLLESRLKVNIADKHAGLWQSGFMPKIDLEARTGKYEMRDMPENQDQATEFLLIAKMDIFSGLETIEERKSGIAEKTLAEENQRKLATESEAALKRHLARIITIQKSLDLEERNLVSSDLYYKTILREYNAGIKNSMDLKAAAELVYESSYRRLKYYYDFQVEKTEAEMLLGSPLDVEKVP